MDQNNLIIISMILASMPVLSYLLQETFSGLEHKKRLFFKFVPVAYLDWVFVPFNVIWIYTLKLNYILVPIFLIIFLANIIFLRVWINVHIKERNPLDIYDIKNKKITVAGVIHLIYAQIQATMIFYFLFFSIKGILTYLGLGLLMIYMIGILFSSKIIHKKVILADFILFLIGLSFFLAKVFLIFF